MSLHSRQGDLLFIRQETRPAADLTARHGNVMVAGETTGHAHRLQSGIIENAPDGALSRDLPSAAKVVHAEHHPISLERGLWLVARQGEDTPETIGTGAD